MNSGGLVCSSEAHQNHAMATVMEEKSPRREIRVVPSLNTIWDSGVNNKELTPLSRFVQITSETPTCTPLRKMPALVYNAGIDSRAVKIYLLAMVSSFYTSISLVQ